MENDPYFHRETQDFVGIFVIVFCIPSLFYIFYNDMDKTPIAYVLYVLSTYMLLIWGVRILDVIKWSKSAIYRHHLGRRYMTDYSFRGSLSLHASTGINFFYALLKLVTGIYYHSFWFGALGIYYFILAVTRGLLLRSLYKKEPDRKHEYQTYRLCGYLLVVLNFAFSAVTVQMVLDRKGFVYPGTLIFLVAFYAFYSITISIINLFRFRKQNNPILSASKILGVVTALVSMLSLQTAMFASFGEEYVYQKQMNALTGGAVCLFIFLMAMYMIVRATREIKKMEHRQNTVYQNF